MVMPRKKRGNRTGYTTGSNAAGAARAATIALFTGSWPAEVVVTLPIGETTLMRPVACELEVNAASCGMVKDAGDDPDVTHGALICARVQYHTEPGIHLDGGVGVGRVTRPGLGLAVGTAAINPVPRQQICSNVRDAVQAVAPNGAEYLQQAGLHVIISVPDGERLAAKTLNQRLGIVGGISILGTSGKVFPYSTAAWRESVVQAIEVATYHTRAHVVLATGARSERFAMQFFPHLAETSFVDISIFTGEAINTCLRCGVAAITLVAMISRVVKTAQGHMVTHVAGNQVDLGFVAHVCRDVGCAAELVQAVEHANTARHVLEICQLHADLRPLQRLLELAQAQLVALCDGAAHCPSIDVILVDFDGQLIARAGQAQEYCR
ncbi:MAG: cobalt-precorrin-5B (C(1))-methyltransferase [Chloroflexaceae bacterium]|nr:cobalt-precorrin-5B (C(1))-methyltransferase [Chloroflexaceae bacterium]